MNRKFKFEKLIRDETPQIMESLGVTVHYHHMDEEEFSKALLLKLEEETLEVLEASSRQDLLEELADVVEVLNAILEANNITQQELEWVRNQKAKIKGSFDKRIYCTFVEADLNKNSHLITFTKDQKKYPEIFD